MTGSRHEHIVACAGAGKTHTLVTKIVELALAGVPPERLLAFTFTERAAKELRERIERSWAGLRGGALEPAVAGDRATPSGTPVNLADGLAPTSRGLFVGTIHAWSLHALRRLGSPYELYEPLSDGREWSLLLRLARRLGIVDLYRDTFGQDGKPVATAPSVEAFQRSLEVVHDERIPRDELVVRMPGFAAVVEAYERLLDEMQLFSFGTMIDRCLDELQPEGGRLRRALEGQLDHVFVDEFQDLNRSQAELVDALVSLGATVHVVGDDDQAIYQWRGGDVRLFTEFRDRVDGVASSTLATNRRSLPHIVEVSRAFAETIRERLPKDIRAHRGYDVAGSTVATEDRKVEVAVADTPRGEAEWVAERVQAFLAQGARPDDIGVLYRSVRTSGAKVIESLRRRGVHVNVVGRLPLFDRPAMALMARVFVLWAGGSWYPVPGGGEERVTRATIEADLNGLGKPPDAAQRLSLEIEEMGRRAKERGVPDLIRLFDDVVAHLDLLPADVPERRAGSLGQFSALLTEFEHSQRRALPADFPLRPTDGAAEEIAEDALVQADPTSEVAPRDVSIGLQPGEVLLLRLRAFLQHYATRAAEESASGAETEAGAVNVMTIHQAKGLEFPIVFLPSLVEGRFPSGRLGQQQSWYLPDDLFPRRRYEGTMEDEARLFYVGMTRAREHLLLSAFGGYGTKRRARISRFLQVVLESSRERCDVRRLAWIPGHRPGSGEMRIETDFGRLASLERCGFQYWLRHECGFQPPIGRPLGFGRLVHHVIAELARRAKRGERPTRDAADRILAETFYLPFAGRDQRQSLFDSARRRLRAYVDRYGVELLRTVDVEREFDVPLALGRVRGRVDLLVRAEGGGELDVELIDFKTASERPPIPTHDNQLRLYAEAMRELGYRPVRLLVHVLDADGEPERREVPYDGAAAAAFRARLEGWLGDIREKRFEPCEPRSACAGCDFRSFCPYAPLERGTGYRGGLTHSAVRARDEEAGNA